MTAAWAWRLFLGALAAVSIGLWRLATRINTNGDDQ